MIVALLTLAATQSLDLTAFFTGKTHADNVIRIAFHAPHKLIVDSIGGHNKEGAERILQRLWQE